MLNGRKIRALKPKERKYYRADFDNLLLCVYPSGTKSFFYHYKCPFQHTFKRVGLGKFPFTNLKQARAKKELFKIRLQSKMNVESASLECVAYEKMGLKRGQISLKTYKKLLSLLQRFVLEKYGKIDICKIEICHILGIFSHLQSLGIGADAFRLFSLLKEIFSYALARGLLQSNLMQNLRAKELIIKRHTRHFVGLYDEISIREFLQKLCDERLSPYVKMACFVALLSVQRGHNVRAMSWGELDLRQGIWQIPKEKMKARAEHILPLNSQILGLLRGLEALREKAGDFCCGRKMSEFILAGGGKKELSKSKFVFASGRSKSGFIGENALRYAFKKMGFVREVFTPHGFRAMFSTITHEQRKKHGLTSDIIELCLAHKEKNAVKASYNHALFLEEKRELMQWWGDYVEALMPMSFEEIFAELVREFEREELGK